MSPASVNARNAANAQHSTGPVTAEGKARSAQNATKHGLTGRTVVLPHENKEEYELLKKDFLGKYRPAGILEQQMVTRMLDCWWILNRALRVEAEYHEQRGNAISAAHPDLSGDAALVNLFTDPAESKSFRLLMRYVNSARAAWRQAKSDFEKMRKEKKGKASASLWAALASQSEQSSSPELSAAQPERGFVSHSAATPHPASLPKAA